MEKIKDLVINADSILVLAHKSPDGDAIGSALAVYNVLLNMHKKVDIIMENIPRIFDFLPNIDMVKETSKVEEYDLVIVLDCATQDRIGQDNYYFENAKFTLNIDHHISNTNYANYNYVSSGSPACCEYLVEIFDNLGVEITEDIAKCLMVGVLTDTGGFQYSNVGKKTFDLASKMCDIINIPMIYKKVLSTKTRAQFELSKIAMSRTELLCDDKVAYTYLLLDDFSNTNALDGDHEGIVEIGRAIEGVDVSIFLRETEEGFKGSLRSNGIVDVNEVAAIFNGGGHRQSAGFDVNMDLEKIKNNLIDAISDRLK